LDKGRFASQFRKKYITAKTLLARIKRSVPNFWFMRRIMLELKLKGIAIKPRQGTAIRFAKKEIIEACSNKRSDNGIKPMVKAHCKRL
jgi:hypothetical protein